MKIMKFKKLYLGTIIVGLTSVSMAPLANATGFNLGLDVGRTEARKFCSNITNCSNADTGFKVDVGFEFNEYFSTELGYTSFGTIFDSNDNAFSATQDSRAYTISGIVALPMTEMFSVYARVGYARYNTDSSGTVEGVAVRDQHGNTPIWGLGAKYDFNPSFGMRLEFLNYANISRVDGREDDVQGMYLGGVYSF